MLPPVYRSVDGDVYLANMDVIQHHLKLGVAPERDVFEHFPFEAMRLNLVLRGKKRISAFITDEAVVRWWGAALALIEMGDAEQLSALLVVGQTEFSERFIDVLQLTSYRGMTLLHYAVVLHKRDAVSDPLIDVLIKAGASDIQDEWGATAQTRAAQLGKSFCGCFFPEWGYSGARLYDKAGVAHDMMSKSEFQRVLQRGYGRGDVSLHNGIIEPEVLAYLLLFVAQEFDVAEFNDRQTGLAQDAFGIVPEWDDMPPLLGIANHGHMALGPDSLGVFATENRAPGNMITMLNGYTQFCIKDDSDMATDVDSVLKSYVSPYAFYLFPLESVLLNYHGTLLAPLINTFPEFAPGPLMFFNDSGSSPSNNVAWMTYFVDGLPSLWFFATTHIRKGEELFGGYMVGSELWRKKRDVEMVQIQNQLHPHIT